jgi:hypothetical protein
MPLADYLNSFLTAIYRSSRKYTWWSVVSQSLGEGGSKEVSPGAQELKGLNLRFTLSSVDPTIVDPKL